EEAEDRPALRGDDAVDVSALGGELEHAARRHHVLDRNRDRYHSLALVIDAGGAFGSAFQRCGHLRDSLTVDEPGVLRTWRRGRRKEVPNRPGKPVDEA